MGKDNEDKGSAVQAELTTAAAGDDDDDDDEEEEEEEEEEDQSTLDRQDQALWTLELKLEDMEDRNRRCNIHITGLEEGLQGSSVPHTSFTQIENQTEFMRVHWVYKNKARNQGATGLQQDYWRITAVFL